VQDVVINKTVIGGRIAKLKTLRVAVELRATPENTGTEMARKETHSEVVERKPQRKTSQTPRRRLATASMRTVSACRLVLSSLRHICPPSTSPRR
jgi:hypothetical protein